MRNRFRAVFTHPPPGAVFPAPWGRIHSAWFSGGVTPPLWGRIHSAWFSGGVTPPL